MLKGIWGRECRDDYRVMSRDRVVKFQVNGDSLNPAPKHPKTLHPQKADHIWDASWNPVAYIHLRNQVWLTD